MDERHTLFHDSWDAQGRCQVMVDEPDGNQTKCGYQHPAAVRTGNVDTTVRREEVPAGSGRRIAVLAILTLVGVALALDWYAFFRVQDGRADAAASFAIRALVTCGYGVVVFRMFGTRR